MNNYGLATADRLTHVRIVAVALIACVAIVSAGKAVRQELSDTNARVETRAQNDGSGQVCTLDQRRPHCSLTPHQPVGFVPANRSSPFIALMS